MIQVVAHINLKDTQQRKEAFENWYEKLFPQVASFVRKQGGDLQDAQDVFQDALIILYEKSVADQLSVEVAYEAYLTGIAKHLWFRKSKADKKQMISSDEEIPFDVPEWKEATPTENTLLHLLEHAGKKCLELLHAIYYDKQPMEVISKAFGFSGAHSASVQKHKCIQKMRETVKAKSLQYGDFE
jgi:RNA polymerase sigma factor (sigma-70 family)